MVKTKKPRAKRAPHDPALPPAFVDFMLARWAPSRAPKITRLPLATTHAARRRALHKAAGRQVLVIAAGNEVTRSADTEYRFRAGSHFFYLTGHKEPDAVLVITAIGRSVLFLPADVGRESEGFFADRHRGELWVGKRLGPAQAKARYGVDEARDLATLPKYLGDLRKKDRKLAVTRGLDAGVDKLCGRRSPRDAALHRTLCDHRLCKDADEVKALGRAAKATAKAFDALAAALPTAKSERVLEAIFDQQARIHGDGAGYGTIVAGGAHACVLHWTNNDGPLRRGQLVLIDAGVESDALYTADVTRTLPVSGRYTKAQREIYSLVLKAQLAAIASVKSGVPFLTPHRTAMAVLAEGLVALGILKCTAEEALKPENQFYRRYTLHGTSHMLGIDVHDCSEATPTRYRDGNFEPGMVLTVEPGLYFQPDDLTVPTAYRGIGIRIEDDILVTPKGRRNLTQAIPKDPDAVERWIRP